MNNWKRSLSLTLALGATTLGTIIILVLHGDDWLVPGSFSAFRESSNPATHHKPPALTPGKWNPENPMQASQYLGFPHLWQENRPTVFTQQLDWFNMSHDRDAQWAALSGGPGDGLGRLAFWDEKAARARPWGISMLHQLHCLRMLRSMMQELLEGNGGSGVGERKSVAMESMGHVGEDVHYMHCFDYLRQSILCLADDTMESPTLSQDGSYDLINGWGVAHTCRDANMLYQASRW